MSVRVIAGSARGRRLTVPDVAGLRPTSDRARETRFNVLAPRIDGAIFLDAFAGCGAVGIEALSRGAAHAVFVERARRTGEVLAANLEMCGFGDRATVVCDPWSAAWPALAAVGRRFDIAFFDPPYDREEAHRCLEDLSAGDLLATDAVAIIEHRAATPPREAAGWQALRTISAGDPSFTFFGILPAP